MMMPTCLKSFLVWRILSRFLTIFLEVLPPMFGKRAWSKRLTLQNPLNCWNLLKLIQRQRKSE